MQNRNFTCCFTGHRDILPAHMAAMPAVLDSVLRGLIAEGYFIFVTGGARGFDTMAAEAVIALRQELSHIRLIVAAPCAEQPDKWGAPDRRRYERIRQAADDYICLETAYTPDCMRRRNKYLTELSSACVAYCLRERSGTSQTVGFARAGGLEVIDILPIFDTVSA